MTQLMMWKRNGKRESGVLAVSDKSVYSVQPGGLLCLLKSTVTDLQEAKAVPLDAVVITKLSFLRLTDDSGITDTFTSAEYRRGLTAHRLYCEQVILSENPHLVKPERMKEPTNFAAVVEARLSAGYTVCKFVFNGKHWVSENSQSGFYWSDLINPVLVSEGVAK